jgi:hypothetical protein
MGSKSLSKHTFSGDLFCQLSSEARPGQFCYQRGDYSLPIASRLDQKLTEHWQLPVWNTCPVTLNMLLALSQLDLSA